MGGTPGTRIYPAGYAYFKDEFSAIAAGGGLRGSLDSDETSSLGNLSCAKEFGVHAAAGMLAEATTCIIYVAVEVVKERIQVQQLNMSDINGKCQYTGGMDAFRRIR